MTHHFRKMSKDYEEIRILPNGDKILVIISNDKIIRQGFEIKKDEKINNKVVYFFNKNPKIIPYFSKYLSQHPEITKNIVPCDEDSDLTLSGDTLTESDDEPDDEPNKYPPVQMMAKPEFQPKPEPEKPTEQKPKAQKEPQPQPITQKEVQKEPEPKPEAKKPKFKQSIKNNNYVEINLNFTFN